MKQFFTQHIGLELEFQNNQDFIPFKSNTGEEFNQLNRVHECNSNILRRKVYLNQPQLNWKEWIEESSFERSIRLLSGDLSRFYKFLLIDRRQNQHSRGTNQYGPKIKRSLKSKNAGK